MTLVYDNRPAFAGSAMTHAFLVGVSDYPHLPAKGEPPTARSYGLTKLGSPALSAWDLCCWLVANESRLAARLGTIHLLMSATQLETANMQVRPASTAWTGLDPEPASFSNFSARAQDWRTDASTNQNDITLFYFGGHGLKQFGSTLLTLSEFGQAGGALLGPTCRFPNVLDGMAPDPNSQPDIARTQFYFIDTCRQNMTDFRLHNSRPTDIWDPVDGVDNRATPAFMAAYPGGIAFGVPGEHTDFAEAILTAFGNAAEDEDLNDPQERWPVSSNSIGNFLNRYFTDKGTGQYAPATGVNYADVKLCWLDQAPTVRFQLAVRPNEKVGDTTISLTRVDGGYHGSFPGGANHPYVVQAPAGIFSLLASDGATEKTDTKLINQQRREWPIRME